MGHKVKQSLVNSRIDFFYYAFRNILLVGIPLVIISAIILSSLHSSATNSGSDNVTLTLSTSCTLSSSVITPHHASLNGGQYEEGIGDTRVNTYCNDNNGYSIYAIGTSNNIDGNTDLVSDIDEHYNIHTGAYVNGNNIDTSTPSFWGMKLTPGVGTGSSSELTPPTIMNSYNSYNVIPSSYTLVASRTSGTNMTIDTDITGSYFNTTYNIYASSVQPAGSYEGRVKYVMMHPHSDNSNITIENAFALNGKERHGLHYAMQDMTTEICNAANVYDEASQTQLIDTRDNKPYWVAKLQDGHCWMTQNLDLDLDPTKPLTSNDTDLTDHSLTGAYVDNYNYDESTDIVTWTPNQKTIEFSGTTVRGFYIGTAIRSATKTDYYDTEHISLGNYYNYSAAIASNDSGILVANTLSDISKNPQNSICPKGWRLPTISNDNAAVEGSTNEFSRLNNLYNNDSTSDGSRLLLSPLYFVFASSIYNGTLREFTDGLYWSSSNVSNIGAYYVAFSDSYVNTTGGTSGTTKALGGSIRCLVR